MDFALDDTQRAVAELASEVLAKELDAGDAAAGAGFHQAAWTTMSDVGLLSLASPPELGGDGLGVAELAVVLTEVGRRAAPVPALATLALGVLPVVAGGSPIQQADLLPQVAAGAVLSGAPSEPGSPLTAAPRTQATRDGDNWRLIGAKAAVPYAAQAIRVLVPATNTDDGRMSVFVVDPKSDGVELHRTPSATRDPEYTVRLDGARAELLGDGGDVQLLRSYALAGAAAVGDGALAGALHLTTEHVRTRKQFGKPLSTFQAVAQQIADVYIASRTVHLAATSAVWRLANGLGPDELELAAYWLATEGLPAVRTCHHLHGGIGVDVSYPLHRHSSLLKDLARFTGGAQQRLNGVGA